MNKFCPIIKNIKANTNNMICGIEAAMSQTIIINGVEKSVPNQVRFPDEMITTGNIYGREEIGTWVDGARDILIESYDKWILPSELGVSWARLGNEVIF